MRYQQVHDPLHAVRKNHQRRVNQIVPNITPVSSNKRLEIRFRLATPISDLMVDTSKGLTSLPPIDDTGS
jgi:hypothetical protein